MNWRVTRLIFAREARDLLRDRRSIFMLLVIPILLYPGFGVVGFLFALSQLEHVSRIGISGVQHLAAATGHAGVTPSLLEGDGFAPAYRDTSAPGASLAAIALDGDGTAELVAKSIDALLTIPPDFHNTIAAGKSATFEIKNRDGDEGSKLATQRLSRVLQKYANAVKEKRFASRGLPADFDAPIVIKEPLDDEPMVQRTSAELRDQLAKFLPFMLVMWTLAGALHPAVDMCAGEKERGTMETLLISPAERVEIVAGKFLAVWAYATMTTWWNLLWMAALCLAGNWYFEVIFVRTASLIACFVLALPMTALFSSLSLAIGAYARSTKEGQYYLLPLFLCVMPLVLLSLAPHAELTIGMSLVPITGLCLLLQKMIGPSPWSEVLPFAVPVLGSLTVYAMLAGWWAVRQFQREEVLFRESENTMLRGWLASFAPAATKAGNSTVNLRPAD